MAPSPEQVVAAAYRAAGLDRDPIPGLSRRAHVSALIPSISVHGGEDATWKDIANPTVGQVLVYGVSASWQLGRLYYDASDFHVASLETARRRERRRLATRVLRLYYRWLTARAAAERAGRPSPRGGRDRGPELDAWTEGWWNVETCHAVKCASSSSR